MKEDVKHTINPKLNTSDSITVIEQMGDFSHDVFGNEEIKGLKVQKFSFAIDDASQISTIRSYLNNFYEAVNNNTTTTHGYTNIVDPEMLGFKSVIEGCLVGKVNDLYFSYNILAVYDQGSSNMKVEEENAEKVVKFIQDEIGEDHSQEADEKILAFIEDHSTYTYKSPMLRQFLVDIYLVWK